ncbi:hypothetical protein DM02DRAFT_232185 [Periconia macrospinosa]|uniref:AAA+ ATPase domain-containing protein n=1 Tax=Periconia macrospinosa TaxID=97972 RepID=A0A2V1EB72_9PLEO|nr:hypothetical protein DM02DRAFT_232185 [Periconia macrospinosa]
MNVVFHVFITSVFCSSSNHPKSLVSIWKSRTSVRHRSQNPETTSLFLRSALYKNIPMPPNGTNVTITNPLVLYRSLIATNRIQSDPAQHRLAIHLQKLYDRLIDYEPTIEYSDRLNQLTRSITQDQNGILPPSSPRLSRQSILGERGIWKSLLTQKEKRDSLALTRVLTSHEAAMALQSPKGLMLHGEVGTGKSMLIDLFADSLPSRKKRRWHFNTFMLETFSRLEQLRRVRSSAHDGGVFQDEYSLLWLARDLIQKSTVLFLDEFQLPDRAASKILSNLMTSFFQLGGVLIATSNRMPEELAKAAGMEFSRPVTRLSRLGWRLGMGGLVGRDDGPGQKGEFAQFLELLRTRCEVWEMEGKKDYRRLSAESDGIMLEKLPQSFPSGSPSLDNNFSSSTTLLPNTNPETATATTSETTLPKHYLLTTSPTTSASLLTILRSITSTPPSFPIAWTPTNLTVYGRSLPIPAQHASGTALFTFAQLCSASLGPADYITLASTYHTICVTDIPVLGFLQKNEARRFVTLLDAMYEARCRLLVTAAAGPDGIFFPSKPTSSSSSAPPDDNTPSHDAPDAVHPETFSEIHQDLTSPFRPNISSYASSSSSASSSLALPFDALEDDPPNRANTDDSEDNERRLHADAAKAPDFSNVGGLTGEDEKFAVKRAESRIWEMCSGKWWGRGDLGVAEDGVDGEANSWWRPLPKESRHWERGGDGVVVTELRYSSGEGEEGDVALGSRNRDDSGGEEGGGTKKDKADELFAHGASPFRTVSDAPPKIQWTHVWGTVKWGKKAGAWGKGVEGLEERKERREEGVGEEPSFSSSGEGKQ